MGEEILGGWFEVWGDWGGCKGSLSGSMLLEDVSRLRSCGRLSEFRWGWFPGQGAAAGGIGRGCGRRECGGLPVAEGQTWDCLCCWALWEFV